MADATAITLEILRSSVPEVEFVTELPPDVPTAPTVMVTQTGGTESDFLLEPIITLTCWGETDPAANALATDCIHSMSAAAESHPLLSASSLVNKSRDSWTATGQSRYMVQLKLTINV